MPRRTGLFLLSLGCTLLVALVVIVSLREQLPPGVPDDYAKRWISAVPCKAPCWEGITPGQTSVAEAMRLLKHDPAIDAASVLTGSLEQYGYTDSDYVTWNWVGERFGGTAGYNRREEGGVIKSIAPYYRYLSGADESFTLREVMEIYGEPTHVYAGASHGIDSGPVYSISILYAQFGLWLQSASVYTRLGDVPDIGPDLHFDEVSFVTLPVAIADTAVSWQGPQAFAFYCRGAAPDNDDCPRK